MADDDVERLLKESVDAQNRTTHAVRAIARFVFIQVVATLIASPLAYFGATGDAPLVIFLAAVVLLIGTFWACIAAWNELELSDRFKESRARALEAQSAAREAAASAERKRVAADREAAAIQRRVRAEEREGRRKEVLSSKRFRIWASSIAAIMLAVGAVFAGVNYFSPSP